MICPECGARYTGKFCPVCGTTSSQSKHGAFPWGKILAAAAVGLAVLCVVAGIWVTRTGGFVNQVVPTQSPDGSWPEGTYHAGTDIPAGEYVVESGMGQKAYVKTAHVASMHNSIFSEYQYGRIYVTVADGDYLHVEGGTFRDMGSATAYESDGTWPEGTYKVGYDMPAGEYIVLAESDSANVYVTSDSTGDSNASLCSVYTTSHLYITVEAGEYLSVSDGVCHPAASVAPFTAGSDGLWTSGMYKVGRDLPAGEYLITCDDVGYRDAYVSVMKDSTGLRGTTVHSDYVSTRAYVTLEEGQYISLRYSSCLPAEDAPAYTPENGVYGEGMYLAGKDLPAGTYTITGTDTYSYAKIIKDSSGSYSAVLLSEHIDNGESISMEVKDGYYLALSGSEAVLAGSAS